MGVCDDRGGEVARGAQRTMCCTQRVAFGARRTICSGHSSVWRSARCILCKTATSLGRRVQMWVCEQRGG